MASPRRTSPPRSKAGPSRPAPTLGDRRGMTLVELIVVTVLGSVILASVYQILVTNQRAFAAQSAGVRNQQSLRAAVDVLFGELREVSPADGDLVAMGDHTLHVRAPRSIGLVCGIVTGGVDPTVQAKVFGRYLRGDSARVFVENNSELRADDVWTTARVAVADTTGLLTCPDGEEAQEIRLEGIIHGAPPDSITDGALIRNFRHFRYGLRTYADAPYLVRIDESGTMAPLVGPLRAEDGVEFRYLDGDGNVAATAAAVRQVEVALRTRAMQVDADGAPLQDSLKLRIYTRNTS